jgi:hypothetical protein
MIFLIAAIVGALTLIGLVMLAFGIFRAPEAFENDTGFHQGEDPAAADAGAPEGDGENLDEIKPA